MAKIINPTQFLNKIAAILEKLQIKYFITGGFAVSVWGRPRATFDVDIVIQLLKPQITALAMALRKLSTAGYINEEAAKKAIEQTSEFNFIDGDTGIKVDFWIHKNNEFDKLRFERSQVKIIDGKKIYFVSPEDLILSKLQWYKETSSTRQLEDVESVLKISNKELDKQYLKKWAKNLGVSDILDKLTSR